MELIGPGLLEQINSMRERVVDIGHRYSVSGRQMARLTGVQEKRVRSYVEDPAWREDSVDLLVAMEAALGRLGLIAPDPATPEALIVGPPALRAETGAHQKVHLTRHAILLDDQIRIVHVYLQAAAEGGMLRERDIKFGYLRSRAPDCALHVYEVGDVDVSRLIISEWRPVADYLRGEDINGADICADFPASMAACIQEDVTAALRGPSRPHYALVRRSFGQEEAAIPNRSFLRLLQYFVGDGDVPKVLVARRLQPAEATTEYFGGLRKVGPREVQ